MTPGRLLLLEPCACIDFRSEGSSVAWRLRKVRARADDRSIPNLPNLLWILGKTEFIVSACVEWSGAYVYERKVVSEHKEDIKLT